MKQIESTGVLNDAYGIWSRSLGINERFCMEKCFVDEKGLNISISCDEQLLLHSDVCRFNDTEILLALKAHQHGVLLAYAHKGLGWNYALVSCDDPDCFDLSDTMDILATLESGFNGEFLRQEQLPEEFASVLRYALLQSMENRTAHHKDCETDDFDADAIVENPDIACVIPSRLSMSENPIDIPTVPNDLHGVSQTSENYKMPEWAEQFSKETNVPAESSPISVDFTDSEFAVLTSILGGTLFNITQLARIPVAFMGVQDAEQVYFKLHGVDKSTLLEKCRQLDGWEQINLAVRILESYCSENIDTYI